MRMLVLIEPIEGGRFRARAGEPFCLSAEGSTADEAAEQLGVALDALLQRGARLATLTVSNGKSTVSPIVALAADDLYKADWVYRELQEAIADNRRQDEAANP